MHLEVLVEEQSAEVVLRSLLPALLDRTVTYEIRVFHGKQDLLKKIGSRLRGYSRWATDSYGIVVLIDRDRDDCCLLKDRLERCADDAGLSTSRTPRHGACRFLSRVVIEELESWFFGDAVALQEAYPRVPRNLTHRANFRYPDEISRPAEALERVLRKASYHRSGLQKRRAAEEIARFMEPDRNTSRSFRIFSSGLRQLCKE